MLEIQVAVVHQDIVLQDATLEKRVVGMSIALLLDLEVLVVEMLIILTLLLVMRIVQIAAPVIHV